MFPCRQIKHIPEYVESKNVCSKSKSELILENMCKSFHGSQFHWPWGFGVGMTQGLKLGSSG